jgi:Acetoacetate decarboxylase (ADC)
LLIGREGFGEPKKMASIDLFRSGNGFVGTVDRLGTRLMSLNVAAGEDEGPSEGGGVIYSIKATLALGGGLVDDASLLAQEVHVKSSEVRHGAGSVKLGGTAHDPLDEFPVLEVLGASYAVSDMGETLPVRGKYVQAAIPAEEFLPFHYGRLDDWSAHDSLTSLESGKA